MYIHLTPSFYLQYSNVPVELIEVEIPELDVMLKNDKEITVRFPSPNKRIHYVCRKKGRKAVQGILLSTDKPISDITVITRWKVLGSVSVHRVHMHIEGTDDAATDCIHLWMGEANRPFGVKTPACAKEWVPAACQPRMTVTAADRPSGRETTIWRKADQKGIIREQTEYFTAATVEPERLLADRSWTRRFPAFDDAFSCRVCAFTETVIPNPCYPVVSACPLQEQVALIADDLMQDGMQEAFERVMKPVLDEIADKCPIFFTNTNNLMNAVSRYSTRFSQLPEQDKEFFRHQVSVPLFEII